MQAGTTRIGVAAWAVAALTVPSACGGAPMGMGEPIHQVTAPIAPGSTDEEVRRPPERPEDARVVQAVRGELIADPRVDADRIDIDARDGLVELRGEVPYLAMGDAAVARAEMVHGVRVVIDATQVAPTDRPDALVRREVESILAEDPAIRLQTLEVRVDDGVVMLRGLASSAIERRLAERAARSVRGVRDVVSELGVRAEDGRTDEDIQLEVLRAHRLDRWVDEWLLEVEVRDGVVMLRGVQPTALARRRAIEAAWEAGARAVSTTGLEVEPDLSPEERRPPPGYVYPADEELLASVEGALAEQPRLERARISVEVNEGVVTLDGFVRSLAARAAAEEAVESVRGVHSVQNRLRIGTPTLRPDADVRAEAERTLARVAAVDEEQVEVRVERGVLTLYGSVSSPSARHAAGEAVRGIEGVRAVRNELELPTAMVPTPARDDLLAQDVITHLEAHPYVDADQIQVLASGGRVTLRGEVDDWRARREAIGAAYDAGALDVLDDIQVREGPADIERRE